MGIFSGSVVTVGASVSRVLEDDSLPNAVLTGVTSSILGEDQGAQIVEHVMESLVSGIGVKAEQMYTYGKTKYLYGVPESTLYDSTKGWEETARDILYTQLHFSPQFDYAWYGSANYNHIVWMILTEQYGYDPLTNQLNTLKASVGANVYLTDFVLHTSTALLQTTPPSCFEQWGKSPKAMTTPQRKLKHTDTTWTGLVIDEALTETVARVSVCWGSKVDQSLVVDIPLGYVDLQALYYQVRYSLTQYIYGNNNENLGIDFVAAGYWQYIEGTGTFPQLDTRLTSDLTGAGTFFPIGYFRYDKKDCLSDTTSDDYKHSKKLTQYIGMDYADVAEAIKENPDIGDVDSAMLMMAVPAITENSLEQRYLFDFFYQLFVKTGGQTHTQDMRTVSEDGEVTFTLGASLGKHWIAPTLGLVLQDKRFKMAITLEALTSTVQAGVLGKVGTASSEFKEAKVISTLGYTIKRPVHIYRKQVTETLYREIWVVGLAVRYHVQGDYAACSSEADDTLLIPVDMSLVQPYSLRERELLYARSLHYVITSYIKTKLKWYQTGAFRVVLFVVAIIITVVTWGAGETALAGLIGATSLAAAWAILQPLLIRTLIMMAATKLFVKVFGEEFAFLAALVAACYGMYSQIGTQLPLGEELLGLSTNLASEVSSSYSSQLAGIQSDMEEFSSYMESKYEALEDAQDLLNNDTVALNPFVLFGECPTNYFSRTCHMTNPGVTTFDLMENYVGLALRLPEFSQTMA